MNRKIGLRGFIIPLILLSTSFSASSLAYSSSSGRKNHMEFYGSLGVDGGGAVAKATGASGGYGAGIGGNIALGVQFAFNKLYFATEVFSLLSYVNQNAIDPLSGAANFMPSVGLMLKLGAYVDSNSKLAVYGMAGVEAFFSSAGSSSMPNPGGGGEVSTDIGVGSLIAFDIGAGVRYALTDLISLFAELRFAVGLHSSISVSVPSVGVTTTINSDLKGIPTFARGNVGIALKF